MFLKRVRIARGAGLFGKKQETNTSTQELSAILLHCVASSVCTRERENSGESLAHNIYPFHRTKYLRNERMFKNVFFFFSRRKSTVSIFSIRVRRDRRKINQWEYKCACVGRWKRSEIFSIRIRFFTRVRPVNRVTQYELSNSMFIGLFKSLRALSDAIFFSPLLTSRTRRLGGTRFILYQSLCTYVYIVHVP